ncbi:MAG: DUF3095 family protein [Mariprofundaceae bacterium]|nr:DUF3095 family protein [Mariprofundaceae bacterium]
MNSNQFYHQLQSFSNFNELTEKKHFKSIPKDWTIVITDIIGSTQAIEEGRYKDVNLIGAAAIVVVQNSMKNQDFPSSFGGDGATMLIPPKYSQVALQALHQLQQLSQSKFQLQLRVGILKVEDVVHGNTRIEVGKYHLGHGRCVAMFRGGGLSLAEKTLKASDHGKELPAKTEQPANLTGLSCHWKGIPSQHGTILSLLIIAKDPDDMALYQEVLQQLNHVFDGQFQAANPVHIADMESKSLLEALQHEARYIDHLLSLFFLRRFFKISIAFFMLKCHIPPFTNQDGHYMQAIKLQSDYKKFDEGLKMVIDCSPQQSKEICANLKAWYREGRLFYGIHESDNSLMTCYVQNLHDGQHIHFIDGDNGGYAMASKQLKEQMKTSDQQCNV